MQQIKRMIESLQPLSDAEWHRIQATIRTQHFSKGDVLQREGVVFYL